jgi:hypothetical protein
MQLPQNIPAAPAVRYAIRGCSDTVLAISGNVRFSLFVFVRQG